jgi:hypothetical protein
MSKDPQHDNIGSVLRWENYLAKEKSIDHFKKLLTTTGDTTPAVTRSFLIYMDEIVRKGESPDLDEIFAAYLQSRWNKVMNINKILAEIKTIIGEVSKKYTLFQKMNMVIRQQLIGGKIPYVKVDDEHKEEYSRKLADKYFPSPEDSSSFTGVPIQPPPIR